MFYLLKRIHGKKLVRSLTGRNKLDYGRVLFAMFTVASLSSLSLFIELNFGSGTASESEIIRNPVNNDFLFLVIAAVLLVPIQAGLEEAFFRGYILQGISFIWKSKIFLTLSTSAIFTVVHMANPEPWQYGVATYAASIFLLGTFMGLITLFDGGLELAIGFHTMNNLWSFLIVGLETSVISTPALFVLSIDRLDFVSTVISGIIQFMLLTTIFAWRYGWFGRSETRQIY
jgi:membrane protease YdiL (CAAX protease family)